MKNSGSITLLAVFGVIASLAIMAVLGGWVFTILWGWFIQPIFGAPVPPLPLAMGLLLTVRYLFSSHNWNEKSENSWEYVAKLIAVAIFGPFLSLGFGYLIHLFV
jgi:hypothetical protein